MKYSLYTLLILCLLCTAKPKAQERKKVAVVLSGGGAKGVAHIGALKVIEKAGIPIDYVVGTSMGSIVGGLYAIGYTPQQLDSMVSVQDWKFLLSDGTSFKKKLLAEKENSDKYQISFPFNGKSPNPIDAGVIKGKNLARLFSTLTVGYHDSIDFNRLPIPFACVSEDVVTGKEVVFHNGVLATAMRASMSIPGVFVPIYKDGMVLIDGGMRNNYPVDVAKQMGADIIIGVGLQDSLKGSDGLKDLTSILGQIVDLECRRKYEENLRESDVHIAVDVAGYSAASFTHNAIDTLMRRGEEAAMKQWDNIVALRKLTGASDYDQPFPVPSSETADSIPEIEQISAFAKSESSLNLGFRFDNEELATVLANVEFYLDKQMKSRLDFTARLGKRVWGRLGYRYALPKDWSMHASYRFGYNDVDMNENGKRAANLTYTHHTAQLHLVKDWKKLRFIAGIDFHSFHYNDLLTLSSFGEVQLDNENLLDYVAEFRYNSLNQKSFPTRGTSWNVVCKVHTDNLASFDGEAPAPDFRANWTGYFSPAHRFCIIPSFSGRVMTGDNYTLATANLIGGNIAGRYLSQQITFAGINRVELMPASLLVAGLELRQRIGGNNYISLIGNYGRIANEIGDICDVDLSDDLIGGAVEYSYNSLIGPLSVQLNLSNQTKKLGCYVSMGLVF